MITIIINATIIPTHEYYGLHLYDLSKMSINLPENYIRDTRKWIIADIIIDHIHTIIFNKYNHDIDLTNIRITQFIYFDNHTNTYHIDITIEDEDLSKLHHFH